MAADERGRDRDAVRARVIAVIGELTLRREEDAVVADLRLPSP